MVFDKKTNMFGIVIGVLTYLLAQAAAFVFKGSGQIQATFNIAPLTEGVKQQIQAGVSTDLASRIIGFLNGLPGFDVMGLLIIGLAGLVIANIGVLVVDRFKGLKDFANTPIKKIVTITVIGSVIAGAIVSFMAGNPELPAIMATITMAIYFTIVAFIYVFIARVAKGTQIGKLFVVP